MDKNFHRKFQIFLNAKGVVYIAFSNIFNRKWLVKLFLFWLIYNKIKEWKMRGGK